MKKKSIFSTIGELYTNATKVIVGDMPLYGSPEAKVKSTADSKKKSLKEKFGTIKDNLLNIGKPKDNKSLLYDEVVKREKQENKEAKKDKSKAKAKTSPAKKKISTAKKPAVKKTTVKKPTVKKPAVKKPNVKKPAVKKTSPAKDTNKQQKTKIPQSKKASTAKIVSDKKTDTKTSVAKKSTVDKTTNVKKTTASKKISTVTKLSKKAEKIALYTQDIKKHYGEVDEVFVSIIVKNLGTSIYKKDAELVSCSDPKELDTVRRNFLVKKLGIDASNIVLDAAIKDVCEELKGVRRKYRATFHYALAKKFKKESVLS